MIYRPSTVAELREQITGAAGRGEKGVQFNLQALSRVIEHTPEDMTVTVETGLTLSALQERLRQRGQWLPIDPPNPDAASIADILNANASGPRRFGYGTIREHLLGIKVVLADGRVIQNGGKVVKNVAGYDLCKLFVGSRGSLGVIVEATFKVRPLPEAEQFVGARCDSLSAAAALLEAVRDSELTPVVFDLHNLGSGVRPSSGAAMSEQANVSESAGAFRPSPTAAPGDGRTPDCWIVLGLAGTHEEVDWQLSKAAALGLTEKTDLAHEKNFWSEPQPAVTPRISVLPSRLAETVQSLGAEQFVARAGNGVIYYRGGKAPPKPELPRTLMQRIKEAYDPKHTLPDLHENV